MSVNRELSLCIIPGDGIGPEVTNCACEVLKALAATVPDAPRFVFDVQSAGAEAYEKFGDALPEATIQAARRSAAVLLGALDVAALPKDEKEPLTRLRRALKVDASIRPAKSLEDAAQAIDVVIVREVTEGFYSGIEFLAAPDAGCAVRTITREASLKVAKAAFALAMSRRRKVVAVHKLGIFKLTDGIFLDACRSVASEYPDVTFETRNVDACAYEMVRHPEAFDVILATNAFGDILSDLAIGIGPGLGLAPSGCVGGEVAYFEPVHGSAPDIAGRGIANPIATILAAAMLLRHLGEDLSAAAIESAVSTVLKAGSPLTRDLGGAAGSREVTAAIIQHLGGPR